MLLLSSFQIPTKNLLGELGQGYKYSIEVLNEGRIGIGAQVPDIFLPWVCCRIFYTLMLAIFLYQYI